MERPYIAVPIGDPAGVGPEITVKAVVNPAILEIAKCVVVGDRTIIEQVLGFTKITAKIKVIENPEEGDYSAGIVNLIDMNNIDSEKFRIGSISGMCGKAAYEYIEKCISLALAKRVAAVSTPPINKEALRQGGVPYIGHTEIFGALTHTADPLTMFEVRNMRIFFLSRHVSLAKAVMMVRKNRIKDYVKRCSESLKQLGVTDGTMAVAGLNPHSGEHGLFGDEEGTEIEPAVRELQAEGYQVVGPIGADSVFHMALLGKFNSVLSLYHDQGHIAAKTLDFERTISLTLGMPILRTSVDHGTAMDIAGKNSASEISMIEAIRIGVKYSPHFTCC